MKRLLLLCLLLTSCSSNSQLRPNQRPKAPLLTPTPSIAPIKKDDIRTNAITISEKMFITQINDIYYNFEDYDGKVIIVEGLYKNLVFGDKSFPSVYRTGPGCCGNDGWAGFLLQYDKPFPNEDDWIEVIGKPFLVKEGVYVDLFLDVNEINVKNDDRGSDFVTH